jgi:ornithine cyclodeaminase/alanine dehydrogenase-like protein (mu-crystallin family)
MTAPLWISEAQVTSLLPLGDAIAALERGLLLEARGEAQNMVKTHATWGGANTLHALGATFPAAGFVGTKTWAHTERGATPLLTLFDSHDGSLKAIIEAFALGQLRTGGISAVATRWLAAPDADELAIIGTGKQAFMQVAAVAAVRPLQRVRVFSPTPERRTRFAARLESEFAFAVVAAGSVAEAVRGAPIVTMVTRATEAFLFADMVRSGTHLNAVGAITPNRTEFAQDIFPRCALVVADSVPSVQKLSNEFMQRYGSDAGAWTEVQPLCRVVAGEQARPPSADLTLFKAMGMGIADLALGIEAYTRAVARGLGTQVPHTRRDSDPTT